MSYRILVADDDLISRAVIVHILNSTAKNYAILEATNGKEAVDMAISHSPDLIVLNWSMPVMDGIAALRVLKSKPQTQMIPVIIETGFTSSENLQEAMQAGAIDYIRNPVDPGELRARVGAALELYEQFRKINQQKDKIQQQIEELKHLSLAAKESSNSIMIINASGDIEWANEGFQSMYGCSLEEYKQIRGQNFFNINPNFEVSEATDILMKTRKAKTYISNFKLNSGSEKWIQTSLTPIITENKKIEKFIAVETDITQLKSIDSELKIKNQQMLSLNKHLEKANTLLKQQKMEILQQKRAIEEEKQNTDKLLLNILPHHVASQLKTIGFAKPRNYKMASVMFTDFQGFTKACEKLSPTEIVEALHTFFAEFDDLILEHYLEKIKTIGDSYMCAGGLPLRNRSNPFDISLAALKIQRFMRNMPHSPQYRNLPFWKLRVGIHTGTLTAGVVGKIKFAYDIWGDTVNIAKRMESACDVGMVNISGATYEYIKDYFDCSYRGKIEIKNRGRMEMYYVHGLKAIYTNDPEGIIPNKKFSDFLNAL